MCGTCVRKMPMDLPGGTKAVMYRVQTSSWPHWEMLCQRDDALLLQYVGLPLKMQSRLPELACTSRHHDHPLS
jgi:hypothetical protein